MHISVNDQPMGDWRLPAVPGEWLETGFAIPASFIKSTSVEVKMEVSPETPPAQLGLFYLWAYTGERPATPEPQTLSDVRFGSVARLVGYEFSPPTWAAGEALTLTLYWQALQPSVADWRIFVHVIDPANDTAEGILAQADAAPRAGTYPFWVWPKDEVVAETFRLTLPASASRPPYAVLVGLYNSANGERAPLPPENDYGGNRLLITQLEPTQ
jgi:hypothetical protein